MFDSGYAASIDGIGALAEPASPAAEDPWVSDIEGLTVEDVTGLIAEADAELAGAWDDLLETLDRLLDRCEDALSTVVDDGERFFSCAELLSDP